MHADCTYTRITPTHTHTSRLHIHPHHAYTHTHHAYTYTHITPTHTPTPQLHATSNTNTSSYVLRRADREKIHSTSYLPDPTKQETAQFHKSQRTHLPDTPSTDPPPATQSHFANCPHCHNADGSVQHVLHCPAPPTHKYKNTHRIHDLEHFLLHCPAVQNQGLAPHT